MILTVMACWYINGWHDKSDNLPIMGAKVHPRKMHHAKERVVYRAIKNYVLTMIRKFKQN